MSEDRLRVLAEDTILVPLADETTVRVGWPGIPGPEGPAGPDGDPGPIGPPGPALGEWTPAHHGLLAWSYDPSGGTAGFAGVAGQLIGVRLQLAADAPVTGVCLGQMVAGVGLTGLYVALYTGAGVLVGQSANIVAANGVGEERVPLAGGPYPMAAGGLVVTWWHTGGTTPPQWLRQTGTSWACNIGLMTATPRYGMSAGLLDRVNPFALADTAPPTLPLLNPTVSFWAGVY